MGTVAKKLDSLTATAESPDGGITARMTRRSHITLRFRDGSYSAYTADELAAQLSGLAGRLRSDWRHKYAETVAAEGLTMTDGGCPSDEATARFLAERRALTAVGASADGRVRATTTGLHEWTFAIAPDVPATLPEDGFSAELLAAVTGAVQQYASELAALRQRLRPA